MTNFPPAPNHGRVTALDGLRGLASAAVVVNHTMLLFPTISALNFNEPADASILERALVYSPLHDLWAGNEAVMIFFILSGLVLALPILRPGNRFSWLSYYPSRLVRLYIPVIAAVALAFIEASVFTRETWPGISSWLALHAGDHSIGRAALDAVLIGGTSSLNTPLWSLAFEVLFSILLPVYILLARRFQVHALSFGIALLIISTIGRYLGNGYLQYLPVFAIGVVFAANHDQLRGIASRISSLRHPRLAWGTVLVIASVLLTAGWDVTGIAPQIHATAAGFPLSVIAAAIIVWTVWQYPGVGGFFDSRLLQWLGRISFSLYLVHEPILVTFAQIFGQDQLWLTPIVGIPVSFIVAQLFVVVVERPSHRLARSIGQSARKRLGNIYATADR